MDESRALVESEQQSSCWRDFSVAQSIVKRVVFANPALAAAIAVLDIVGVFAPDAFSRLINVGVHVMVLALSIQVIMDTWFEISGDTSSECLADRKERKKQAAGRLMSVWGNSIYYGLACGLGTLCFILPGIYVACMGCLGIAIVCIEGLRAASAFDASWKLMKGHWRNAMSYLAPTALAFGGGGFLLCFGGAFALQMVTIMLLPEKAPTPEPHPLGIFLMGIAAIWLDWVTLCQFSLQTRLYKRMKEAALVVVPALN